MELKSAISSVNGGVKVSHLAGYFYFAVYISPEFVIIDQSCTKLYIGSAVGVIGT